MGLVPKRERIVDTFQRFQEHMEEALRRVRIARLQITEATTIEELDIGKSNLQMAFAEVQRVVRLAKADAGLELRPVEEVEERYRRMVASFRTKPEVEAPWV